MQFAYNLTASVGTPIVKKYQIGNSTVFANYGAFGVIGLAPAANAGGVGISTTTSFARAIGVTLDANTYTTTQGVGSSSAERKCSFIVNPDAVYKAKLSGGATENTALSLYPVTTASAGGTAITTGTSWTSTEFDEGVAWFYDGANVGQIRKITSTSSTAGTVTIPFDVATVVGDNAMRAPFWPGQTVTLQATTNLYQIDASIAVGTGGAVVVIDADLNSIAADGRNNSYVYFKLGDHAYSDKA